MSRKRSSNVDRVPNGPKPTPLHQTPREARQALDELLTKARRAPSPDDPKEAVRTLRDAWEEWLRHIEFDRRRFHAGPARLHGLHQPHRLDRFGTQRLGCTTYLNFRSVF